MLFFVRQVPKENRLGIVLMQTPERTMCTKWQYIHKLLATTLTKKDKILSRQLFKADVVFGYFTTEPFLGKVLDAQP